MIIDRYKELANHELCQKLKELGVRQDAIRYWYRHKCTNSWFVPRYNPDDGYHDDISVDIEAMCAAYSVAELGWLLPRTYVSFYGLDGLWHCGHIGGNESEMQVLADGEFTEADARANMLIYLIKSNLINVEDIGEV